MSASKEKRPIIIRKKVAGHSAHHGGSWKVAYADFVTAMMAFFLVMWILGMSPEVKDLVEGYFSNPVGYKKAFGSGRNPVADGNAIRNLQAERLALVIREAQRANFERAAKEIQDSLESAAGMAALRGQIEIVLTPEGLRIELLESGTREVFFHSGSAEPTPQAVAVFQIIGAGLRRLPNPIVLEGHTDARPFDRGGYTNWELSVDRANAARRLVLASGVAGLRIIEVRGYAAQHLRLRDDPFAAANRRVTLLLPYVERPAASPPLGHGAAPQGSVQGAP